MNSLSDRKRIATNFVVKQLRLRGYEDVVIMKTSKYDISVMCTKDDVLFGLHGLVKIKVKYSRLVKRSALDDLHWEFKHIKHNDFMSDKNIIDFHILVGIDTDGVSVTNMWLIPADDDILRRSSYIFILAEEVDTGISKYSKYEFKIIKDDVISVIKEIKEVKNMPGEDGKGPYNNSTGPRNGRGRGKGRGTGEGAGSKTGGEKGKC